MKYALAAMLMLAGCSAGGVSPSVMTASDPTPDECLRDIIDRCEVLGRTISPWDWVQNRAALRMMGFRVLCSVAQTCQTMPGYGPQYTECCDLIHQYWPAWAEDCPACRR